jgi:peptidyl-prolyl cis-trans isomerase SurA
VEDRIDNKAASTMKMRLRETGWSARRSRILRPIRLACVVLGLALGTSVPAAAQQVAVMVNGEPITTYDIEQRGKFLQLITHKVPVRQDVLEELINDKLKVQEARHFKLEITEIEVDTAFANMGKRVGLKPDQLKQVLAQSGIEAATLRARIRAEIAWSQIVRGRYASSLQIGDNDIREALAAQTAKTVPNNAGENNQATNASPGSPDNAADNKDAKDAKDSKEDPLKGKLGSEYTMRPILFIIPHGSGTSAVEERKHEAEELRARFDGCDAGLGYARSLRYVAVRDQIIRNSADLVPSLRQILDTTPVGHLTPPETTEQGVQVFAICSKKQTLSDTPEVRDIKEKMFAQKFDQQSKRYLADLHRSAMIEIK